MKASNIGMWIIGAVLAWVGWILLDMSSTPALGRGTAGLTSVTMNEIRSSSLPVMVEFYADWCGPCKIVGPVVDQLSEEVAGRAKVIRLNVDHEREMAAGLGIRSIPTFVVFNNGQETARKTGAIPKALMKQMLGL